jgi:hypothetical protein
MPGGATCEKAATIFSWMVDIIQIQIREVKPLNNGQDNIIQTSLYDPPFLE